jgi:hypothetical protein
MLLSATEAIYSGNLPVKKLYSNTNLAYKPKEFPFCSTLKPLVIQISGAGIAGVNGIWYLGANGASYFKPGSISTYGGLDIATQSVSGWKISIGQYVDVTTYYQVSGLSPVPGIPPLTGWRSLNPIYDPPPILTYNQPLSAVYETFLKTSQVNIVMQPTLEPDRDYFFNIENNTFFGNSSSTQFANITSISNVNTNYYEDFDTDYFSNLKIFSGGNIKRGIGFNNSKLQQINIFSSSSLRLYNNLNLQNINLGAYGLTPDNIINSPQLSTLTLGALTLGTNSQVTNVNIQAFPNLRNFTVTNNSNLTSLQTLSSYPGFESLIIGITNLSGFEMLDTFLNSMSSSQTPNYLRTNSLSNLFFRSSASNNAFFSVYKKMFARNINPTPDIDPFYPVPSLPTSYYPSTLGNRVVVSCPISANNTTFVQHRTLSGIYTKVDGAVYNNRDIFRNVNDFYILYDSTNTRWTVVGPTSGSGTIWLSAQETFGDYGNIPALGWGGPAYIFPPGTSGRNGAWWISTSVYSTQLIAFSADIYSGSFGSNSSIRPGTYPLSGWNADFLNGPWSNYDFSGIGYQDVNDPTWNGRFTLVSPVHFLNTTHFPNPLVNGSVVKFIHRDNTISTRTVLSSRDLGSDVRLGILSSPVSAAAYPIGSMTNFITGMSVVSELSGFLWGPGTTSRIGIGLPLASTTTLYNLRPENYFQITNIPKSLWFTQNVVVGDSSTQFWYADPKNKQLSILGITQSPAPSGPHKLSNLYTTIYNTATALCQQFYGTPLMYQLTAYNF